VLGLPKQIRRFYEGVDVIKEGKRVAGKKVIDIDDPIEQFRAMMRGQYGPLEVQKYYRNRDLKIKYHKQVSKAFSSLQDMSIKNKVKESKPTWFKQTFWSMVNKLPKDKKDDIYAIFEEAKGRGIELSFMSILNQIKSKWE
jgi:hypothetical protein